MTCSDCSVRFNYEYANIFVLHLNIVTSGTGRINIKITQTNLPPLAGLWVV